MFSFRKYLLNQKYSFLRDAVEVKKGLRKYSRLSEVEYPLPSGLTQEEEMGLMMRNVLRGLAIWEIAFSLGSAKSAYRGGLDSAKGMLEHLAKDSRTWGIEV